MSAPPPAEIVKAAVAEAPKAEASRTGLKKSHRIGLGIAAGAVLALGLTAYLIYSARHETTDDAYTTGNVHDISSRVAGTVTEVAVQDNQFVRQGQVLARLDPRDFAVQVDKARADYLRAKADFERATTLVGSANGAMAISKQEYDQMQANMEVAKAALDDATDQLQYCDVVAPADGFVGNKTVQTGNRVAVGTVLMSVVEDLWVVANYKETQLGKMQPGQPVDIRVDEISGRVFRGHVDSFSPGSGSVFALLPPENATGNFTKIVQRVPVKIVFDRAGLAGYEGRIVPGLSVETDVNVGTKN